MNRFFGFGSYVPTAVFGVLMALFVVENVAWQAAMMGVAFGVSLATDLLRRERAR